MKNIILIMLSICLLLMVACQTQDINTPQSSPQIENSQMPESKEASSQEQNTANKPQENTGGSPLVMTKLATPIHILLASDNKKAYTSVVNDDVVGMDNLFCAAEKELAEYTAWMNLLDAKDITAIYGESVPIFEYVEGDMSLEDSQSIFEKLKAITPYMKTMTVEERRNPYTGGGWTIAIHQGDNVTTLFFNGGWIVVGFTNESNYWVFNVDKTPAQAICIEINDIMSKNMNHSVAMVPEIEYQGSKLEHLYATDTEKYVMAEITEHSQITEILKGFEGKSTEQATFNGYGYLLFNGDGKQYQYLQDDDEEMALTKSCLAALANSKLHPSWLIHFDPEKIVNVNGITDKTKISELSNFLKNEVTTGNATQVLNHPTNPNVAMGDFLIKIKFNSDVEYTVIGTDYFDGTGNMSIYTNDLNKTIGYKLDNGVAQKITAFLKDFN